MKHLTIIWGILTMLFLSACTVEDQVIVTNFEECVEAGNPVMESYPRQCAHEGVVYTEVLSLQERCENLHGGTWLEEHNECEYVTAQSCEEMGGAYESCASACRHDPNTQVCTLQCVPVCSFS